MVVVTIAALYLGMRANFDPSIGPARLIYAFEAVIIGGLGSLWGTLAGGIDHRRRADHRARQINPEWQILAGHIAFLVVLLLRPRGLFPAGGGLRPACAPSRHAGPARHTPGSSPLVAARGWPSALPAFASRSLIQDLFFILTMLTLAQFWNLLAGYGGMVRVGQQAFVGIGAYAMFGRRDPSGRGPGARHPARRAHRARCLPFRRPSSPSACRAPISPSAPGSSPR